MKVVVSHPTGNANVRAVVTGFAQAALLEKFYTSVAYFEQSAWLKLIIKDIVRRQFNAGLRQYTKTHSAREIARHICNRLGLYILTEREKNIFSVDAVYKSLDEYVAKEIKKSSSRPIVYSYEDGSYYNFIAAKQKGLTCVYDLPIAYWKTTRKLLMEEAERLPAWKKTLGGGIDDSEEKLARKHFELVMADLVITPSSFVAESVSKEIQNKKIIISPFGTPDRKYTNTFYNSSSKKLRVLFVGSMGQRKGLADLASAIKFLGNENIELIILGSYLEGEKFYKKYLPNYIYEAPRPHEEVLKLMSTCDVFCLPSIVEGRALVMQEAMSCNLPIIITKNTGGEDLIIEGETGFLVPIRSPEIIAEKINWFWENRTYVKDMGIAAAKHANTYTWQQYTQNIVDALFNLEL